MASISLSSKFAQCRFTGVFLGIVCSAFLGWQTLAAQEPIPTTSTGSQAVGPNQSDSRETAAVPPDTPVLTITGLCNDNLADKTSPANCKTVITRAEFEKIVGAVQPKMTVHAKREFALNYSSALIMARNAEQMGLDKGEIFEEQMRIARIEILSKEMKKVIQAKASQISDAEIESYYHDNTPSFEQADMERIYIPKTQDSKASEKTVSDAGKRTQGSEASMKEVAEELRARAVTGEDFNKLQTDAYQIAGVKATANSALGKIRRISLPRDQVSVIDLKPGEISPVIEALNGYFIYRIKSKETLSMDQVREEIKGILRSRHLQEETEAIEGSTPSTLNENYFRRPGVPLPATRPADKSNAQ